MSQSLYAYVNETNGCVSALLLWKATVELSNLCDVKPADFLPHDAVEKQGTDAFDLASGSQSPKTHLKVAHQQDGEAHQGVVDGKTERKRERQIEKSKEKDPFNKTIKYIKIYHIIYM